MDITSGLVRAVRSLVAAAVTMTGRGKGKGWVKGSAERGGAGRLRTRDDPGRRERPDLDDAERLRATRQHGDRYVVDR